MIWIKITHTTGSTCLNLDQVYKYEQTSPTELTFYSMNSINSYSFSTNQELIEFMAKLSSISKVIDIDQLATQG